MKKLLLILAIPVLVIVLGVAALVMFVNPNQFKPMLAEQVKNQTGLELEISGDISWQFFPSVGLELGQTSLKNPQGFQNPNLFSVSQVGVSVAVMPLLDKTLEIGSITLDGAQVYLETLKDGRSNLDALTAAPQAETTEEPAATSDAPAETSTSAADGWQISLSGVTVSNALLEMSNAQTGTFTKLYDVGLNVTEFAVDQWTTANFELKGQNNEQQFTAKGTADFKLAQGFAEYALKNIEFDATYTDAVNQIQQAQLKLATFEFDKPNAIEFSMKGNAADLTFDAKGGTTFTVDKAISLVELSGLSLDSTLNGAALPQSPMKITMASDLSFDLNKSFLDFVLQKLTVNKIELDGKATVQLADIPKVRFSLHSPNIDLDEFLGLNQTAASADSKAGESGTGGSGTGSSGTSAPAQEVEPDLTALSGLDVQGKITIDKFKAGNAHMQQVKTDFAVNRGVATLNSFSSQLYSGSITATGKLDARKSPASYSAVKRIKGVKVQPLLVDVANNDMLEGTGNIDVNVKGKGLTPTAMKKNLSGTVKINFADGAVNGINVAQLIRENYARFKGQSLDGEKGPKKTDFSAMKATLKLANGVVSTNDMTAESPLLRVKGQGSANYINETADFVVSTSVVGTLKGRAARVSTSLEM
ncbi:A/G-specific adenine glycosylase [Vibrio maritimus]|uniref:A/G-specific adenine glycosylase n=1 Tax=Vibrio maritimus TaxID=990268 RepID=A0A090TUA1_9VIBR|nr:A/G-specific adenine glycosylase [Vibrio maritimus]